jgi:hypothetical protein
VFRPAFFAYIHEPRHHGACGIGDRRLVKKQVEHIAPVDRSLLVRANGVEPLLHNVWEFFSRFEKRRKPIPSVVFER